MSNLAWILPLAIGLFLVIMAIWLVILWVSSRGRFMFLHCVALNTAEVRVPWQRFAAEANSLFLFRLVVGIGGLLVFLPLVGGLILVVGRMIMRGAPTLGGVLASAGLFAAMLLAGLVFWIIGRLTRDFVVPIQFLRHSRCLDAWREFRGLASGNVGNLALYLLFRILLGIGIAVLVIIVVVATCCIAGCLLLLPYLGTVFLLPILVFERSYSLSTWRSLVRITMFSPRPPHRLVLAKRGEPGSGRVVLAERRAPFRVWRDCAGPAT